MMDNAAIIKALNDSMPVIRRISTKQTASARQFDATGKDDQIAGHVRMLGEMLSSAFPSGCAFVALLIPVGVPGCEALSGDNLVARLAPMFDRLGNSLGWQVTVLVQPLGDDA